MRIDRTLFCLRLCKSRSLAQRLVEQGHIRCNGERVTRSCHDVAAGDVLTVPVGQRVHIIEIASLPERRGPASEAQTHYRALDPAGQTKLAAGFKAPIAGKYRP